MLQEGKSFSGHERNCAFLNLGGSRFADVSSISGIDFPDDGRSMGVVDWDHDGDLDLWLLNRTAPRLRFLRNETDSLAGGQHGFVAFRLRGTNSNRDAIGARVELHLSDPSAGRRIQTLAAGDSFLSQSSKWIHFGLGGVEEIAKVSVRWPGGATEEFTGLEPGGRYELVEGEAGAAATWAVPERTVALQAAKQVLRERAPEPVRVNRMPMPMLRGEPFAGGESEAVIAEDRPTLLVLWASWCAPCVAELKGLVAGQAALRATGVKVVALTVDGLDPAYETQPVDAQRFLKGIDFPFESGVATPTLLEKLERVQQILFQRAPSFGVPVSFLVDREGSLRAIYRGRVDVAVLLEDLEQLDVSPAEWRARSVPFGGRWLNPPTPIDALTLADPARAVDPDDTERFLRLAIAQRQRLARSGAQSGRTNIQNDRLRREVAQTHGRLAGLFRSQGRIEEAVTELRHGVGVWPDYAAGHNNLALLLRKIGRQAEALHHSREAARLQPGSAEVHNNLANTLRANGKISAAIEEYDEALRIKPGYPSARRNLVAALDASGTQYAATGLFNEAISLAKRAMAEAKEGGFDDLTALLEQRLDGYRNRRQDTAAPPKKGKRKRGRKQDGG